MQEAVFPFQLLKRKIVTQFRLLSIYTLSPSIFSILIKSKQLITSHDMTWTLLEHERQQQLFQLGNPGGRAL